MPREEIFSDRLGLPIGFEFEGFRILKILGRGGFGITYLANDLQLNARIAIKELFPRDFVTREDGIRVGARTPADQEKVSWAKQRFIEEGRMLKSLNHPNIVRVFRFFERHGTAYMIMEYVPGQDLREWMHAHRHPSEQHLRAVLMPLLTGLEYVHQKGFLHRDISPENIRITEQGRPVLLDFGSARAALTGRKLTTIIREGYSPIEQYQSVSQQRAFTDLYALAAVMIHCITGQLPPQAIDRTGERDPFKPLTQRVRGKYSESFLRAIEAAFAVMPQDRPRNVAQWRRMLKPQSAPPPEKQRRVTPLLWLAATAPILLTLVAGYIFFGHLLFPTPPDPNPNPLHGTGETDPNLAAEQATKENPFTNSLQMKFVPVPTLEAKDRLILLCIHQTRRRDYASLKTAPDLQEVGGVRVGADEQGNPVDDAPVVNISQEDAKDFCKRLSNKEQHGRIYRLPTISEWRTALGSTEKLPYPPYNQEKKPLGNYMDQTAERTLKMNLNGEFIPNYNDGYATIAPVMHFPANVHGLYDMGGNVEEWCSDEGGGKAFRMGASWSDYKRENIPTPDTPRYDNPTGKALTVGFRCVLELDRNAGNAGRSEK
jgi:serine/threonine protein kinase